MGLFGKKKEEEPNIEFGFPAAEQREKRDVPPAPQSKPVPPAPPSAQQAPPAPPETVTPQTAMPKPVPVQPVQTPKAMPAPQPIQPRPDVQEMPSLEPRPIMAKTRPEEIRAPTIHSVRPHVFLKINKYREVMDSIDEIMSQIKDLKKHLDSLKTVEEKEALKIKDSEEVIMKLESVASAFDKIFSNPEK